MAASEPAAEGSAGLAAAFPDEAAIKTAVEVLKAVSADQKLFESKACRDLRKALGPLLKVQQERMYEGKSADSYVDALEKRKRAALERNAKKMEDQRFLKNTQLRAGRMQRLQALGLEGLPAILDGVGDDSVLAPSSSYLIGDAASSSASLALKDGVEHAAVADVGIDEVAAEHAAVDTSSACDAGAASSTPASADGSLPAGAPASCAVVAAGTAASGAASTAGTTSEAMAEEQQQQQQQQSSAAEGGGTASSSSASSAGATAAAAADSEPASSSSSSTLHDPRACYICKRRFRELHHFYDTLCPSCAELNWRKRNQTADLSGRVALVTGARVKIGFHCCLKLLRCGASVIATTRFPVDAAERFAAQPDFSVWRSRLHVYGLDLRDLPSLESFCALVLRDYPRLDVMVHNACQTVRRPPAYYSHMMPKETAPLAALPAAIQPLVAGAHGHQVLRGWRPGYALSDAPDTTTATAADAAAASAATAGGGGGASGTAEGGEAEAGAGEGASSAATASSSCASGTGSSSSGRRSGNGRRILTSAELSQVPFVPGDRDHSSGEGVGEEETDASSSSCSAATAAVASAPSGSAGTSAISTSSSLFPSHLRDVNAQAIDLRRQNSWLLRLEDVSTPELVEVMAINAMAPFIMNSRLKPLMMVGQQRDGSAARSASSSSSSAAGSAAGGDAGDEEAATDAGEQGTAGKRSKGADDSGNSSTTLSTGHSSSAPTGTHATSLAETILAQTNGNGNGNGSSNGNGNGSSDVTGNGGKTPALIRGRPVGGANKRPRRDQGGDAGVHGDTAAHGIHAGKARFIVNVSAMEGKFYRAKLPHHPHTNMAKAALNMMTRTSAQDYATSYIYMTAVDTGWINDENPLERAAKTAARHNFTTPLDEVDAAARILDPVLAPLQEAAAHPDGLCAPQYGCFLKDYFVTEW